MSPAPTKPKRKVFIVDDHPLVREWLSTLVNQQADLAVCGEAGEEGHALELIAAARPDLAVVDISLAGGSGLDLIKQLRAARPDIGIVVLSMHDEGVYAERAIRAGALGYVMKRDATKKVLQAIRSVLEGKLFVSEKIASLLAEEVVEKRPAAPKTPVETLSDRELAVFELVGHGYNTRQIALELKVRMKTVQGFCARIKKKLGLANATQLLQEATRWQTSAGRSKD